MCGHYWPWWCGVWKHCNPSKTLVSVIVVSYDPKDARSDPISFDKIKVKGVEMKTNCKCQNRSMRDKLRDEV